MRSRDDVRARKLAEREVVGSLVAKFGLDGAYDILVGAQIEVEARMDEQEDAAPDSVPPPPLPVPAVAQATSGRPAGGPGPAAEAKPRRAADDEGPTAATVEVLRKAYPKKLRVQQVHAEVEKLIPGITVVYMHQILSRLAKKKNSPVVRTGKPFKYCARPEATAAASGPATGGLVNGAPSIMDEVAH